MTNKPDQPNSTPPLSRRGFLRGVGVLAAAVGTGVVATGCDTTAIAPAPPSTVPTLIPVETAYPEVPYAPSAPADPSLLKTFTPHEARTVEALTARILPGTPDDPGAREAGVATYIDNMLAFQEGYVEKTYRQPPFAEIYEGTEPPAADSYQQIWVAADEIGRYGTQSLLSPREVYRLGIMAVDRYARAEFGPRFIDLNEDEQDIIITLMASGDTEGFEPFGSKAFFMVLRRHTAQGMFSDPAYGGNRGMVGWSLIGYPGAQRGYTPADILSDGPPRAPQSLAQMAHFAPGHYAGPDAVLPVSGSEEQFPVHSDHP